MQDYALGTLEVNTPMRAARLREILGGLGPSFVKIGQALSSPPTLRIFFVKSQMSHSIAQPERARRIQQRTA